MKKNNNVFKIISIVTSIIILGNFSVFGQLGYMCDCEGQTMTKTYRQINGKGTFTIKYVLCPPTIKIADVKYSGWGSTPPFLLQTAMDFLLNDNSLSFDQMLFQGECAAMIPNTTSAWGEGSGDRGVTDFNLRYCTDNSTCCYLSRQEATTSFLGLSAPFCRIYFEGGITIQCFTICHPNH